MKLFIVPQIPCNEFNSPYLQIEKKGKMIFSFINKIKVYVFKKLERNPAVKFHPQKSNELKMDF